MGLYLLVPLSSLFPGYFKNSFVPFFLSFSLPLWFDGSVDECEQFVLLSVVCGYHEGGHKITHIYERLL